MVLLVAITATAQTNLTVNFSIVADTSTPVPGGSVGNFTTFNPAFLAFPPASISAPQPIMSNGNVAFWGAGAAKQGIYDSLFGTLSRVADLTTAIPGGSTICFIGDCSSFASFSAAPSLSGDNVLFFSPQQGIYSLFSPSPVAPAATINTLIPNGTGTFTDFGLSPALSGLNFAFIGDGVGQQGVYAAYPTDPSTPPNPVRIADLTTSIPGGEFGAD